MPTGAKSVDLHSTTPVSGVTFCPRDFLDVTPVLGLRDEFRECLDETSAILAPLVLQLWDGADFAGSREPAQSKFTAELADSIAQLLRTGDFSRLFPSQLISLPQKELFQAVCEVLRSLSADMDRRSEARGEDEDWGAALKYLNLGRDLQKLCLVFTRCVTARSDLDIGQPANQIISQLRDAHSELQELTQRRCLAIVIERLMLQVWAHASEEALCPLDAAALIPSLREVLQDPQGALDDMAHIAALCLWGAAKDRGAAFTGFYEVYKQAPFREVTGDLIEFGTLLIHCMAAFPWRDLSPEKESKAFGQALQELPGILAADHPLKAVLTQLSSEE